jgi:hypothetical protein
VAEEFTPERLAEELRKLRIEDLVLSTVTTLGQLAYAKLETKDLDQARLAIDAMAALLPTLEDRVDAQVLRDFKQLLANTRLAYANAAAAREPEPEVAPQPEPEAATEPAPEPEPEAASEEP